MVALEVFQAQQSAQTGTTVMLFFLQTTERCMSCCVQGAYAEWLERLLHSCRNTCEGVCSLRHVWGCYRGYVG